MTQPWPVENVTAMREDAALGLTSSQCALKRNLHVTTVRSHAKLNDIEFARTPNRELTVAELAYDERPDPVIIAQAVAKAKDDLADEIRLAKQEAPFARPYKGHPDDY